MTLIGQRAAEIARAIREGVMSAAFEVVVVPPAIGNTSRFDEATMANVFAGISGAEKGRVLCTVEFGLACVRRAGSTGAATSPDHNAHSHKRNSSHGSHASSTNGNGTTALSSIDTGSGHSLGPLTRSLLLKPKVILESVREVL